MSSTYGSAIFVGDRREMKKEKKPGREREMRILMFPIFDNLLLPPVGGIVATKKMGGVTNLPMRD